MHNDSRRGHRHPLYGVWATMRSRCNNPNFAAYRNYGARGINVCSKWTDYVAFKTWAIEAGYQPGLELDRINVNGDYSAPNCRWVPRLNNRNKRNNRYVIAWGETKAMVEWVEDSRCLVSYAAMKKRLNRGWTPEQAMTAPLIPTGTYDRRLQLRCT